MENASPSKSQNPALQKLVAEFEQTKELIRRAGFSQAKTAHPKTVEKMQELTPKQIENLSFRLKVTQFLSTSLPQEVQASGYNQSQLSRALDFFGLEIGEDEKTKIDSGDVVEIYDQFSTQLYRSLNFFETSGYSLEDLFLNEWYVLWERPKFVMEQLTEIVTQILQGQREDFQIRVVDHAVREIFHPGTDHTQYRLLNVQMKYAFPLRKKGSQKVSAFVVTTRCQIVANGPQAQNIKFI